jgi:hypothetical protein
VAHAVAAFILIPYSVSADRDCVREILLAMRAAGRPRVIAGSRCLVENASRFAGSRARAGLYEAIREALDEIGIERWAVGVPERERRPRDDRDATSDVLIQEGGTKLSREEVLTRISSVEDLLALVRSETRGDEVGAERSLFDWTKAIRKVTLRLDGPRIRELAAALRGQWRETFCLIELSRRALAIGDRELARSLAEDAVARSSHSGWDRFYDGGSRLEAFGCLIETEPERGRDAAWK